LKLWHYSFQGKSKILFLFLFHSAGPNPAELGRPDYRFSKLNKIKKQKRNPSSRSGRPAGPLHFPLSLTLPGRASAQRPAGLLPPLPHSHSTRRDARRRSPAARLRGPAITDGRSTSTRRGFHAARQRENTYPRDERTTAVALGQAAEMAATAGKNGGNRRSDDSGAAGAESEGCRGAHGCGGAAGRLSGWRERASGGNLAGG
jgi:hypothetical protein